MREEARELRWLGDSGPLGSNKREGSAKGCGSTSKDARVWVSDDVVHAQSRGSDSW